MAFGKPMVWREMKDHITDCYFCMTNLKGINRKNKHHVQYPDVPSATKPVPHGLELPVPNLRVTVESSAESEIVDGPVSSDYGTDDQDQPKPLTQGELNDLTRDLNLSKESAQLLGSLVYERNVYWHQPQHSIGIDNARPNLQNSSRTMERLHWSTVTILLT